MSRSRLRKITAGAAGAGLLLLGVPTITSNASAAPAQVDREQDQERDERDLRSFEGELQSLNDSDVEGTVTVEENDDGTVTVSLETSGHTGENAHAQHIHIGGDNECPSPDAAGDDDLLTTTEGQDAYGSIAVSLTTRGDVGEDSALELNRFPEADDDGEITYERTFELPDGVSIDDLADGVVVQHGIASLSGADDEFDGDEQSSLDDELPLETTIPAACGELSEGEQEQETAVAAEDAQEVIDGLEQVLEDADDLSPREERRLEAAITVLEGFLDDGEGVRSFEGELESLNDSDVEGTVTVEENDDGTVTVSLETSGHTGENAHAQHIHIGGDNECPSPDAAGDDDLLTTTEGQDAYGSIAVSLTTRGDVGEDSALELNRFPEADDDGEITYERTFELPDGVSIDDLADGVVVQHGIASLSGADDEFDGDEQSSLDDELPLETTIPAACGELSEVEDDDRDSERASDRDDRRRTTDRDSLQDEDFDVPDRLDGDLGESVGGDRDRSDDDS